MYFFIRYKDNSDKSDIAKALLAAGQGDHAKIVECILQKDNTLIVERVSNDEELWKQAITEELTCVFEVLFTCMSLYEVRFLKILINIINIKCLLTAGPP